MSIVTTMIKAARCALVALLVVAVYEVTRSLALPRIGLWQSHFITIGFCGLAVFVVSLGLQWQQAKKTDTLQHDRENFQALLEHAPGLACIIDQEGRFRQWNSRLQHTLGYSAEELARMPAVETLAEEFRERVPQRTRSVMNGGSVEMEAEWKTKDGRRIPCYIAAVHVVIDGQPCRVNVGIDLSKRKAVEDALRKSDEQYRRLLANLPDVTWTIDAQCRITYISPNVQAVLGYAPEEVLGGDQQVRYSRIHPDDVEMAEKTYDALFRENRTFEADYRMLHKDGRWIWVCSRALRTYEVDGVRYADGTLTEISQRKHAEQADSQLASIVQSSSDAITGHTVDGTIVSWNPAAETMFGYASSETIGRHVSLLVPPERMEDVAYVFSKIARGERIERFDSVVWRKDGSRFDVSLAVSPVVDKDGKVLGVSVIAHDISLRKRTERQLLEAKETAEAAARAKTEFLANISHELRTPMNAILGMTELALDTELDAEQREYLLTIRSSGTALMRLISNLLDFSKADSGKLQLNPVTFHLAEIVRQTLRPLSSQAQQVGLRTVCDIDPTLPETVIGDPGRLRQILVNLIGNAIKFTHEGTIAVQLTCKSRREEIAEVLFTVSDTGIGVSPQRQAAMFDPFTQNDGSSTRRYGGTGMGLAISARLVKLMGGEIWLESAPGTGTTVFFSVPLRYKAGRKPAAGTNTLSDIVTSKAVSAGPLA